MVKLNFLSTPPISTTFDGEVEETPEVKETSPLDVSIENAVPNDFADSIFEFDEKSESAAEEIEEMEEAPPVEKPEPEIKEYKSETASYMDDESEGQWKKFTIFGVAAVALIIIGYFVAKLLIGLGDDPVTEIPTEQPAETQVTEQDGLDKPVAPAGMKRQHSANMKQNFAVYKNMENLLKQPASEVVQSLLVLSPPEVQVSILANSRDDIAQYHMEIKNNYPNFGFDIVSVHSAAGNGSTKLIADLVGEFPVARGGSPATGNGKNITLNALQREIMKIASQAGVKVSYYKQGKTSGSGSCNCYVTLTGETGNLLNFFNIFAKTLPQTKLNKVALNSLKEGSGLNARADFGFTQ